MDPAPLGTDTPHLLLLNGPNLNRLGRREPEVYGSASLDAVVQGLRNEFEERVTLTARQSNHEGELIDALHEAEDAGLHGVVFNPGGFAHTSVALRDAVAAIALPVIEVHLSNVHAREPFRHRLMVAPATEGVIAGLGPVGYALAVHALLRLSAS